jgi:hypothetical protein
MWLTQGLTDDEEEIGLPDELKDILLVDLDRLQEVEAEQDGKRFILRTPVIGVAGKVFQAVGVALPPNIREVGAARSVA